MKGNRRERCTQKWKASLFLPFREPVPWSFLFRNQRRLPEINLAQIIKRATGSRPDQSLPKNLRIPRTATTIPGSAVPMAISRIAFFSN